MRINVSELIELAKLRAERARQREMASLSNPSRDAFKGDCTPYPARAKDHPWKRRLYRHRKGAL